MKNNSSFVADLLKYTYSIVPIVAGLDKFTNLLTDWSEYISPGMEKLIPIDGNTFMIIVGVIEIIAGILVFLRPKIGALIVMAWLIGIALTLLLGGHYFDVAIRDLVIAIGAFSLFKLSEESN